MVVGSSPAAEPSQTLVTEPTPAAQPSSPALKKRKKDTLGCTVSTNGSALSTPASAACGSRSSVAPTQTPSSCSSVDTVSGGVAEDGVASGAITVSVRNALSYGLIANFMADPDMMTVKDILEYLDQEAPLAYEHRYELIVGDKILDSDSNLLGCGCSSDAEDFEILACVTLAPMLKLHGDATVAACVERIRQLPGHLASPAQRRDWEHFDDRFYENYHIRAVIEAVAILARIEKKGGGLGSDAAMIFSALPLLDPEALADYLSNVSIRKDCISKMLATLKRQNLCAGGIITFVNRNPSPSMRRVGATSRALCHWLQACIASMEAQNQLA
eukprot:TRINITY_DN27375_c0_g1_i1.p1 TRINITY_DN27375_c0_g1~~TRINITY_DN27375_c0_g1_i1.p1  ORF type:complete len:330 (+),score=63.28 TRINITY_DN27375_c0_g1_i1:91-1080(+)